MSVSMFHFVMLTSGIWSFNVTSDEDDDKDTQSVIDADDTEWSPDKHRQVRSLSRRRAHSSFSLAFCIPSIFVQLLVQTEILSGLLKTVLPAAGKGVKRLLLNNNLALNDHMVILMFIFLTLI